MKISEEGLRIIKNFESLKLESYKCVPTELMYTIGYGHYGVPSGMKITESQAEDYLRDDLVRAETCVNRYNPIYNFTQNEFDALVSFAFNVGSINALTKDGKRSKKEISDAMLLYVNSGKKKLQGLVKRRTAEKMLFDLATHNPEKTASQLAVEVLEGKWGNGKSRQIKLESAGYNFKEVQLEVNKLLNR